MKCETLEDISKFVLDGTHGSPTRVESGVAVLSARNVNHGELSFETDRYTTNEELNAFESRVKIEPNDLLVTIVGTIGRAALVSQIRPVVFQRSVAIVRPDSTKVVPGYLFHATQSDEFKSQLASATNASSQAGVYLGKLKKLTIPLPPLSEQKRIAEILDRAEALRAKRRAALALLDELTQSIFLDMFGDPVSNPKGWPTLSLLDVISMPLRNGLSPSKSGKVLAKVLTLSAITGSSFDPSAVKESTFMSRPPLGQSVNVSDFLICRGNGNLDLVGRGFFPRVSLPNTTFPDTMIAARIDSGIKRPFLERVWTSRAVRTQIEAAARTTNGTYKVNQTMLEAVEFICPPIDLQSDFENRVTKLDSLKSSQKTFLSELDQLFASLQHRAFRGEL